MSLNDLSDDTAFAVEPKPEPNAVAIRDNIGRIESSLTEFDKISAGLDELRKRFPPDLVYDVSTAKGMAEAIAHRAAWREPRINVEKFRKTAKAPVLALGKDIDARAAWLTEQLLVGETPVHEQIKAEEARKEAEKQAKIAAEFGRVQAIQDLIGEIHMDAMAAMGKGSAEIAAALDEMRARVLAPEAFQEMLDQAKSARAAAIGKLELALKAKQHDEAEAAKVAAERRELEELRAAAAAQKAKDEAAAAELRRQEGLRIEAERAAEREKQARLDAEAAAARREADRVAAEKRAAEQAAYEADLRAKRQAAEAAHRAEERLRNAAPTMLKALRDIVAMSRRAEIKSIASAAIAEAVEK